ncbi:MAG: YdcF family protein [Rubellimicrobium sp.]|nr:YdcF family protein [Rubellimicrobium sp.]
MGTAFFVVSKLVWGLVNPGSWIALGLALAVLGAALHRRRLALWAGLPTLAFVVTLSIVPLGEIIARPLEMRYPVAPPLAEVTGIIVLGGSEWPAYVHGGQPQVNAAGERLIETATLARTWPEARVVFTGGDGGLNPSGRVSGHAAMARALLVQLGVAPGRIELESRSRNTAENATFSHALVDPQPGETWVLVTSASHMPRAMASFARAGWEGVIPWPVDYRSTLWGWSPVWDLPQNLFQFTQSLKEYVGLVAYALSGR